eukprot:7087366-Prorocentrum_lima.AAC.1
MCIRDRTKEEPFEPDWNAFIQTNADSQNNKDRSRKKHSRHNTQDYIRQIEHRETRTEMDAETQPDREYWRVDEHGHQPKCETTDTRQRQADSTLEWYERLTTH